MSSKVIAVVATLITSVLRDKFGCSWGYAILFYFAFISLLQGYHMFIYQRVLSPLSKLPGPKVFVRLAVLTVGSLVLGRVSRANKQRARTNPSSLATRISKFHWPHIVSRLIVYSSSDANVKLRNSSYFEQQQHLCQTRIGPQNIAKYSWRRIVDCRRRHA